MSSEAEVQIWILIKPAPSPLSQSVPDKTEQCSQGAGLRAHSKACPKPLLPQPAAHQGLGTSNALPVPCYGCGDPDLLQVQPGLRSLQTPQHPRAHEQGCGTKPNRKHQDQPQHTQLTHKQLHSALPPRWHLAAFLPKAQRIPGSSSQRQAGCEGRDRDTKASSAHQACSRSHREPRAGTQGQESQRGSDHPSQPFQQKPLLPSPPHRALPHHSSHPPPSDAQTPPNQT